MRNISIAIPYYNRSAFIIETIKFLIGDDRISEIVINDDNSHPEDYAKLMQIVDGINKITVFRNDKNLGTYYNKIEVLKRCTNEWVYLLDSDNYLYSDSLDALYNIEWNEDTTYNPAGVFMNGNREPYNSCSGNLGHDRFCGDKEILFENVVDYYILDGGFGGFLNTGNFFVNKNKYLSVCQEHEAKIKEHNIKPFASDGIFFNYLWLSAGNKLRVVPSLNYFHRIHNNSTWSASAHESQFVSDVLIKKFITKNKNLYGDS